MPAILRESATPARPSPSGTLRRQRPPGCTGRCARPASARDSAASCWLGMEVARAGSRARAGRSGGSGRAGRTGSDAALFQVLHFHSVPSRRRLFTVWRSVSPRKIIVTRRNQVMRQAWLPPSAWYRSKAVLLCSDSSALCHSHSVTSRGSSRAQQVGVVQHPVGQDGGEVLVGGRDRQRMARVHAVEQLQAPLGARRPIVDQALLAPGARCTARAAGDGWPPARRSPGLPRESGPAVPAAGPGSRCAPNR